MQASTPKEMKDLILRRLGAPIINVEVSEEQVFDCISRAIELFIDYHPDGLKKTYIVANLSEEQARSGVVPISIPAHSITKVLRTGSDYWTFGGGDATHDGFTDFLSGLSGGAGGSSSYSSGMVGQASLSSYYMLQSYQNTINDLLNPEVDYWYDAMNKIVRLQGNLSAGDLVVFEAYVPSAILVSESATGIVGNTSSRVGSFSDVSAAQSWDDPYSVLQAGNFVGNPELYSPQGVYGIRWVKDMSTAYVKQINGIVLKKHQGMQMPGGISIDGQSTYQEATEEIRMLREELMSLTVPMPIMYG